MQFIWLICSLPFLTAGKNVPMFMYLFQENTACAGLVGPHLQADARYSWLVTRGAALIQLQVQYKP
jgi:hypothetical protein